MLLRLLVLSKLNLSGSSIGCGLNENQINFFTETVGAVYLIPETPGHYSFSEGYVIEALEKEFESELDNYGLTSSLNLLKDIVALEGRKSSIKGAPFEAMVVHQFLRLKGNLLSDFLSIFGISFNDSCFKLPSRHRVGVDDTSIVSQRPLDVFLRPSNLFRPDILAFLSEDSLLAVGIKFYTFPISFAVHHDNLESTDPDLFFQKNGRVTDTERHRLWRASISASPIRLSVRVLIELPGSVGSVDDKVVHEKGDDFDKIIVTISGKNMGRVFDQEVCDLVNCVTGSLKKKAKRRKKK
jgi:hypothetical protein